MITQKPPKTNETRNIHGVRPDYLAWGICLNDKTALTYENAEALAVIGKDTAVGGRAEAGHTVVSTDAGGAAAVDTEGGGITLDPAVPDGILMPTAGVADLTYPRGSFMVHGKVDAITGANQTIWSSGSNPNSVTGAAVLRIAATTGFVGFSKYAGSAQTAVSTTGISAGDTITAVATWGELGMYVYAVRQTGAVLSGYNSSTTPLIVEDGTAPRIGRSYNDLLPFGGKVYCAAWWDCQLSELEILDLLADAYLPFRPEAPVHLFEPNSVAGPIVGRVTDTSAQFRWMGASGIDASGTPKVRVKYAAATGTGLYLLGTTSTATDIAATDSDNPINVDLGSTPLTAGTQYVAIPEWTNDGSTYYPFPLRRMTFTTKAAAGTGYLFGVVSDDHTGFVSTAEEGVAVAAGVDISGVDSQDEEDRRAYYAIRDIKNRQLGAYTLDFILNLGDSSWTRKLNSYYYVSCAEAGAAKTIVDQTAPGTFAAWMVGCTLWLRDGDNYVPGKYRIVTVAGTDTITLDRSPLNGGGAGADGMCLISPSVVWGKKCANLFGSAGHFFALGNHEEEHGFQQAYNYASGDGDSSGMNQSPNIIWRKARVPNPSTNGETEAEPTPPRSDTAYTSNVNWIPDLTVGGDPSGHATAASNPRDYFNRYIYESNYTWADLDLSAVTSHAVDADTTGAFTDAMKDAWIEIKDGASVVGVYQIETVVSANEVHLTGYDGGTIEGATGYLGLYGRNCSPRENYYTFTWGDVQFFVLDPYTYTSPGGSQHDDNRTVNDWTLGDVQTAWLASAMGSSTALFKIVCMHHLPGGINAGIAGATTGYYGRGSGKSLRRWWRGTKSEKKLYRLCKRHKAIILKGHDHGAGIYKARGVTIISAPCMAASDRTTAMCQADVLTAAHPDHTTYPFDYGDARLQGTDEGMITSWPQYGYLYFYVEPTAGTLSVTIRQTAVDQTAMATMDGTWLGEYVGPVIATDASGNATLTEAPRQIKCVCLDADGDFHASAAPEISGTAAEKFAAHNTFTSAYAGETNSGIASSRMDEPYPTAVIHAGTSHEVLNVRVHNVPRDLETVVVG